MSGELLLDVRRLNVTYHTDGGPIHSVVDAGLRLAQGEFVGIVGESGCGKSTLLFAIAHLLDEAKTSVEGQVEFRGKELTTLSPAELAYTRWQHLSVVMQSAMNALNPVMTIGAQFDDAVAAHGERPSKERSEGVLRLVGIDPIHLKSYPHQLSGGMRQRAMIAMALLFRPELVIMDEPTTALDVVAQRSLLIQVRRLQRRLGFSVLFVTHNMGLVSRYSDRTVVMYAGQVVEEGDTRNVFASPAHPYTKALIDSLPRLHARGETLIGIPGSPPNLADPPRGCRFHDRCAFAFADCSSTEPDLYPVGGAMSRCLLYRDGNASRSVLVTSREG